MSIAAEAGDLEAQKTGRTRRSVLPILGH